MKDRYERFKVVTVYDKELNEEVNKSDLKDMLINAEGVDRILDIHFREDSNILVNSSDEKIEVVFNDSEIDVFFEEISLVSFSYSEIDTIESIKI